MIRTLLVVIYLALFFIFSIPIFIIEWIIGKKGVEKQAHTAYSFLSWVCRCISFLCGTELTLLGKEKVPENTPVLYVSNHRSYFDIVTVFPHCNNTTGFVGKIELERIPILRKWMRFIHCEFIDRNDVRQGLKAILRCVDNVKNGSSMFIFPEGTRTPGDEMLEFKGGSFKIAERSGCPVIPVAISNTDNIFENHIPFIKKQKVTVEFGDPIDIGKLSKEEKKHLAAYVQKAIEEMLAKNHIAA